MAILRCLKCNKVLAFAGDCSRGCPSHELPCGGKMTVGNSARPERRKLTPIPDPEPFPVLDTLVVPEKDLAPGLVTDRGTVEKMEGPFVLLAGHVWFWSTIPNTQNVELRKSGFKV